MPEQERVVMGSGHAAPAQFVLTAQEDFLVGVKLEGTTLTIGPSGGQIVSGIAIALVFALFSTEVILSGLFNPESTGYGGRPVTNGIALAVLGVLLGPYGVGISWVLLRQRLQSSPTGLEIRHGLFRTDSFDWSRVHGIAIERSHQRVRTRFGPSGIVFWLMPVATYDRPVVTLTDGARIELGGLKSTGASEGWSVSAASGADQRLAILLRYRESILIPWPTADSTALNPRRRSKRILRVLGAAAAVVVVFGFHYWITA